MAILAQGARIWVADDQEVWQKAFVVSTAGGVIEIQTDKDGSRMSLPTVYYLRNEEQMTKEGIKGLDDLTQLTHLHEAALLHSLHERFDDDSIYTFTGPILIAVNPFKRIPGLYDEETLKHFIDEGWKQSISLVRKPHVFSTAVDAYRGLCKDQVNQTILISGESGAGKTESTKFVMKLLALAGSQDWQRRSPVENQVLQSNPLLEAFGNAKTLRNDNSSRFGKFIEMQFRLENDRDVGGTVGRLAGARIQTYLLESVRVCRQLQMERNYHAFYQLASIIRSRTQNRQSLSNITIDKERALGYGIDLEHDLVYDLSDFDDLYDLRYLSSSGCQGLEGVDDSEEFERTALAMNTVGISVEEQQSIWRLVGCVLEIGGLYFGPPASNSEASEVPANIQSLLKQVSSLLQVHPEKLEAALCNRTIIVQRERYKKPLTVIQAEDTRDALARALYGTMFLRIVYMTNQSIGYQEDVKLFSGVLDIFGFECFDINSFEQLCINFTNERLQQFFNTFIFKCEEALYQEEGIAWDPLDFPDNQDCVELMAGKGSGIFAMLDEECLVPKGNDIGFCSKLKQTHKQHRRFSIIKTRADWFTVEHFAGPVNYCSKGFLDKNRDQLSQDVQDVIKSAGNKFVASLFTDFLDRGNNDDNKKQKKQHITVSLEFRTQLSSLMDTVQSTAPHFIRCVKPNPRNKPDIFHRKSVAEQLRYAGVLQAVQVSRAGYPVRDKHDSFFMEYRCLLDRETRTTVTKIDNERARVQCAMERLEELYKIPKPRHGVAKSWAVGASLVFLKHEAYQTLSTRRYELRQVKAVQLQAYWKMYVERRSFLLQRAAAIRIQCAVRCWIARRQLRFLREQAAQIIIAAYWRRFVCRRRYLSVLSGIVFIQACWRSHMAKQEAQELRRHRSATKLQAAWRRYHARVFYRKYMRAIVLAQLRWRQIRAKRLLRKLKLEARDTANVVAQKEQIAAKLKETSSLLRHVQEEKDQEILRLRAQLEEAQQQLAAETCRSADLKTQLEAATAQMELALSQAASGSSTMASPLTSASPLALADSDPKFSREAELRQALAAERRRRLALETQLGGAGSHETGTSMSPKLLPEITTASVGTGSGSSRKDTTSPAVRTRKHSAVEEELKETASPRSETSSPRPVYEEATPGAASIGRPKHFRDTSPGTGRETASTVANRKPTADRTSPLANGSPLVSSQSELSVNSPREVTNIVHELLVPETDLALRSEIEDLRRHVDFLTTVQTNFKTELSQTKMDLSQTASELAQAKSTLNSRELELAQIKKLFHESEQQLQAVLPMDCGEYINQVVGFLKPVPDVGKEDGLAILRGDVLLVGDVGPIVEHILTPLEFALKLDDLNFKRLEELRDFTNEDPATVSFSRREFDAQLPGSISPVKLTVVRWNELLALSAANKSRLERHFRYVILCASEADANCVTHPLWSLVHADSRKLVAWTISDPEMTDKLEAWNLFKSAGIDFLTASDIKTCLPSWSRDIRAKRDEFSRDMTRLMEASLKQSPGARKQQSSTSSPMSKSQAATMMNSLLWNGVSSFFGVGRRGLGRGPGRTLRLPPPPVAELLSPSLNGDEQLLAENRDRERALKNGELLRWYSIEIVNRAAVTCLKFGDTETSQDFYLLAVATKAGTITTYKIRRTEEEKNLSGLDKAAMSPLTDTGDADWNAPPEAAVETWRHFEGHTKAVTSLFFSHNGTLLVSTSIDNTVRFWDLRHGYPSKIFSDSVPVLVAAFLPTDPRFFLTSNSRQVVRVVDSEQGQVVQRMKVDSEIRALCFDTSGLNLIAGTKDGALETYEIGEQIRLQFTTKVQLGGASHSPITCVRYCSGQPPFIVVNSCDNTITIATCNYSLSTVALTQVQVKQRLKIPHTCVPLVSCLVRREDHVWLVSGSEDHKVKVHAQSTTRDTEFQMITELKGHESTVLSVDVNAAGTILASADVAGCVHLWRRVSYKHLRTQPESQSPEHCPSPNPEDSL
eukprot:Gregarina_sp_Poly_1__1543@NODE_138_length_13117_cov_118_636935_g123_i0_p1_GENE_NODE_138_length_13117_cov_118_636935_g123_i0NODE_138_length_13117_cov_118_636935_g123_i0_p1_ORF_typecomplete_len1982_score361_18Myosin_head/PF00063_21/1_8e221ANAPC4_WD40/PF12894_7/17ANAPC4_WD40/PF12894_7/2_3e07ANAPC4_WD40/PF12894_7/0_0035ANAPC4_WD40/PF12894_7/1_5e05WD40/PF00400_32/1_9e10WD40/PF00400_32/1e02WD40/PF00400_32/1_8e02WD40/PF00400_32/0_53WD40/PF00400_32/0_00034Ge1_WD40/PF16529_5/0_00094Ge1_WD40/PF16529_5/1_7